QVVGVDRHAVAQVGRVRFTHATQVGRDAAVAFERIDLVSPDAPVERIAVHEQDGRTIAADLDRQADPVYREPLRPAPSAPRAHVLSQLPGAPNGPGFS